MEARGNRSQVPRSLDEMIQAAVWDAETKAATDILLNITELTSEDINEFYSDEDE